MHMAVPYFDTGQIYTYLFLLLLPLSIGCLLHFFAPRDPAESALLLKILTRDLAIPRFPFQGRSRPRNWKKRKIRPVSAWKTGDDANNPKAKTYLWALALTAFKVGCCVEYAVHLLLKQRRGLPRVTKHQAIRLAFQADGGSQQRSTFVRFDSNSFPVGVDNHTSRCLANNARLFKNLRPFCSGRVGGIEGGLEIKGQGTLVLDMNDDNGKPHRIHIPNSLYLPDLRMCLLSPQHWAQEAGDNYPLPNGTRMENTANNCILIWGQGAFKKTVPFNPSTNTPMFYTFPKTVAYRAFASTFMALEAPFFWREHVLQAPGICNLVSPRLPEEEFVAEENINYSQLLASEGEHLKDPANRTQATEGDSPPSSVLRRSALTFDPSPPLKETKEYSLLALDDEAELMRWHYRLGHAPFSKLCQLALNGEIPKRLAKVRPPPVRRLSFRSHDESPLVRQRAEIPTFCLRRHQAGGVRLRQPPSINRARFLWPIQGVPHQDTLQKCHRLY